MFQTPRYVTPPARRASGTALLDAPWSVLFVLLIYMFHPLLGIVATAIGLGAARACCGVNLRKRDPHNLIPITMASLTALTAVWSYFNPPPDTLKKAMSGRV